MSESSTSTARRVFMVLESTFPVRGGGGAEAQIATLGRYLTAAHIAVTVVVPMVAHGSQSPRERIDGLDIIRLPYPKIPLAGALLMLARLAWTLWAQRKDYDVIHAHIAHNMAAVCCLMGRLVGKPVIVKLTGLKEMAGGILDPEPRLSVRFRKLAMRLATYYQATSARIGRLLVESGFDFGKVRLIPNAVDTQRFSATGRDDALRAEHCGTARRVGLYVGRLEPEKGVDRLLDAWAQAFSAHPDVMLIVVGDGRQCSQFEAQCKALGIASQVVFVGPSSVVQRFMGAADFGVLPSLAEGLSNTMLEYMSAGLPVIGSRVSGTEDFVRTGETGWLFEPDDVAQLAACLREAGAIDAAHLQALGAKARAAVQARASIAAVGADLMALYGLQAQGD